MTNKKKANEIVNTYKSYYKDIEYLMWYDLEDIAMEMAIWKDKQFANRFNCGKVLRLRRKAYKKGYDKAIEKACEWLDKNIPLYEDLNEKVWGDMARNDLLNDLKNEIKL